MNKKKRKKFTTFFIICSKLSQNLQKSLKVFYKFLQNFLKCFLNIVLAYYFIFKSIEIKYCLYIYIFIYLFVVPTKNNFHFIKQILEFLENKSQLKSIIFNLKQFNCFNFS